MNNTQNFSFGVAAGILCAYIIIDGLNALYTMKVTDKKAFQSATIGSTIHFCRHSVLSTILRIGCMFFR